VTSSEFRSEAPRALQGCGAFRLRETARAKVNLTLEILGRRADGYHALRSLVAFADLVDELCCDPDAPFSLRMEGPFAAALEGNGNLVQRAAELFVQRGPGPEATRLGQPRGAFRLVKRIPVAAGLGGGSADAAAALRLLNWASRQEVWAASHGGAPERQEGTALHGPTPEPQDLEGRRRVAEKLGADVPVCLFSRPAIMTGIGDELHLLPSFPSIPAVLVNPRVPLPTAAVFRELGAANLAASMPAENPPLLDTLDAVLEYAASRGNDLEAPARRLLPVISTVLDHLAGCPGALLRRLSGSGPTCFALFREPEEAAIAATQLRASEPGWWVEATVLR
jgi:4-diphosphocytidyl-2-C-methyl-D-erythritol kinase